MRTRASSPVQPVSFGDALKISLNNYYDLMKAQIGSLATDEFLQLKLVADPVSVSDEIASKGGYRWWSYYNLLRRSDLSISPEPLSNQIQVSAVTLADVYGDFLDVLIKYVALLNLSQQDQKDLADIKVTLASLREENQKLAADDQARWHVYADLMGYNYGDQGQYAKWEAYNGNSDDISSNNDRIAQQYLERKRILNKQYQDPVDKDIVEASRQFDNQLMQLAYPQHPDYLYSDGDSFTVNYLSQLAGGSSSLFDSRRVITWNQTLKNIMETTAGGFTGTFDHSTADSHSITQDWGASGSAGYFFVSVSASASEHTKIQEEFKRGTALALGAAAAFRLNIVYPSWFQPKLFPCKHVKENPQNFVGFFGDKGTLLYYPTALILVRGFSVEFTSTQAWTYDYEHSFSASAGGGFSAFGISFGGSSSYSEHTEEHKVDQSNTKLTFSDDKNTIRFIGYAVAKNTAFNSDLNAGLRRALGENQLQLLSPKAARKART